MCSFGCKRAKGRNETGFSLRKRSWTTALGVVVDHTLSRSGCITPVYLDAHANSKGRSFIGNLARSRTGVLNLVSVEKAELQKQRAAEEDELAAIWRIRELIPKHSDKSKPRVWLD